MHPSNVENIIVLWKRAVEKTNELNAGRKAVRIQMDGKKIENDL